MKVAKAIQVWIGAVAIAAGVLRAAPAISQDSVADFYRGKTIFIYVSLPAGGSYDTYARLIGEHLGQRLPGAPTVVVQNMPGGGSLLAANFVYSVAPQDGTVIGAMSSNVPFQQLLDATGVKFDTTKINWLPCPAGSNNLLTVWHASPIQSFEDLRQREAVLGTLAAGSNPTVAIGLYKHVLGAKLRAVLGYDGLPSVILAMSRGEVDGYSTIPLDTLKRVYGDLWKSGKLRILAQSSEMRSSELPDIPTMSELAKTPEDKSLIALGTVSGLMTFPYMMGPSVPKERVEAMRAAFASIFDDPEFRREAAARQIMIDPLPSERVQSLIKSAYATPAPVVQRLKDIVALQGR